MANKYIIHGATFNGDGTSSAAAASNGGAGAWNNLNVFEGTAPAFGTLAAGDTVYIRSKDAAGANITRTMAATTNLGTTAATAVAWVRWILDNGTVWSGVDGTITYTHASIFQLVCRIYNHIVCRTRGSLVIRNTSANQAAGTLMLSCLGRMSGPRLDWTAKTGSGQCIAAQLGDDGLLESPVIDWGAVGGAASDLRGLIRMGNNSVGKVTILDPLITLVHASVGLPVFYGGDGSSRTQITVLGGSLSGPGATSGQPLYRASNPQNKFKSIGFRFPRTMDVLTPTNVGYLDAPGEVEIIGCDDGVGGHMEKEWGFVTSRSDSNPPTLQATLPDAALTPWAWRVYPAAATEVDPMMLTSVKMVTGADAVKTITQELLVADTMTVDARSVWITVDYQDATTGDPVHVTTRDYAAGALASSTAGWSAVVWGAISLLKRKLSVVTPSAVKANTPVVLTLWGTVASASANDIYFVDPDFGVV